MDPKQFSYANLSNLPALEELYLKYSQDPQSVESSWRHFFEGMEFASSVLPQMPSSKKESPDLRIYELIDAYRKFGHLMARINPIATQIPEEPIELNLNTLGFSDAELNAVFPTCGFLKKLTAPLKEIVEALKKTYCEKIGIEYMGLGNPLLEKWLQEKIEPFFDLNFGRDAKIEILRQLNKAEMFESFLHTNYVGQKRFSLEGGETLIPMLSAIVETGSQMGVEDVILGMSHRGRLNVLANILNKSYALIFHEFADHYTPDQLEGTGDVKYHKGFEGEIPTASGKMVRVTLVANPSHLESVDPVVEGIARALQELKDREEGGKAILPILLHGDGSIAGQGVVYETLQLSDLSGYKTSGTLHIVINNQIGFTTLPKDARSTRYCTDIAKAFGSPVFHVNAEDPEGCVYVARLAAQIRHHFHCDVFIDLNCYRKYGHNESDEPNFTQPLEYSLIKAKRSIREILRDQLIEEGVVDEKMATEFETDLKANLKKALDEVEKLKTDPPLVEHALPKTLPLSGVQTGVSQEHLIKLAQLFCAVPPDMKVHPKIQRLLQDRLNMVSKDPDEELIDWGMGELLAYASLVDGGTHVRLSGEDVRRGTFSHRHAVWVDQVKEKRYCSLSHMSTTQAPFDIYNSPLSEFAVLGFDFGYSVAYPKSLVIWEAQFGDFTNGAQVIIDQYLASCEQKWNLKTNLTLLLPHGYEGQGPEHSSARLERFLQLAGHDNMRIVNCTTPVQLFHVLRAQALLEEKKPLILFSPKALLRHPLCVSSVKSFAQGHFEAVLEEKTPLLNSKTVLFCSGKIVYDLMKERKNAEIAIIRIEQLYPFPKEALQEILSRYTKIERCFWVQEEHQNMGAWEYIHSQLPNLEYIGRDRSASPAAGSYALHKKQYAHIMDQIFEIR